MKIEVTQQGMDALDASIAKWREASEDINSEVWWSLGVPSGCPLCHLYHSVVRECADCPLRKFTGVGFCKYPEFYRWGHVESDEEATDAEVLQATKGVLNVLEMCKENCVVIEGEK